MIQGSEDEELAFIVIPVAAHAAEDRSTVIQGVGQNTNSGFAVRDNLSLEIGMNGKVH